MTVLLLAAAGVGGAIVPLFQWATGETPLPDNVWWFAVAATPLVAVVSFVFARTRPKA